MKTYLLILIAFILSTPSFASSTWSASWDEILLKTGVTVTGTELGYVDGVTSSIQTQIDLKAPLASPALTGNPTTPNQSALNNSTRIANTSYVDSAITAQSANTLNLTGNQSASGTKTFTGKIVASSTSNGFAPCPSMTNTQILAIVTPAAGDCAYNTTSSKLNVYSGSVWGEVGGGGGISPWLTATGYTVDTVVIESNKVYKCLIAHTSGTFATDLAALKWAEVSAGVLSGKAQNTSSVTMSELQTPNNQLTETATGKYLHETGNKNILANASFENPVSSGSSPSWTYGFGSATLETTKIVSGVSAVKMAMSAQAINFYQDSTLYAGSFADGLQGVAMMWVWSDSPDVYLCARNNSTLIASTDGTRITNCVQHSGNSKYALLKLPIILGATNNGVALVSLTASTAAAKNITANIYMDDAFLGAADLKTDSVQIQTQTTKFTAGSTAVNTILTGTPTTVGAGNFTISSGTMTALRDINVTISCRTVNSTTVSTQPVIYVNGVSTGIKANNAATTSDNVSATWAGIVPSGQTFYCRNDQSTATNGDVVVLSTNTTNTQIYSSSCGANCVDKFLATISTAGVVSKTNVAGWVTSTAGSSGSYTLTFPAGIFTTAPSCQTNNDDGNTRVSAVTAVTTTSANVATSSTGITIGNAPFNIECSKVGADFIATRNIVGSFNEMNTTPSLARPILFSVNTAYGTCSSSPCTLSANYGGVITSVTRSSAGNYVMNMSGLSATPNCAFTVANSTSGFSPVCQAFSQSSSAISFQCGIQNANGTQDVGLNIICHGSKL